MQYVTIAEREGVVVVRMDRPPANALDRDLGGELIEVAELLMEGDQRAVVLAGNERFFSAGLDLKVVPTLGPEQQAEMVMGINRMVAAWCSVFCPVVTAVTGHAIAGGLILALTGDYRIGATVGKLGLTEVRAGVPYPAGAMAMVRWELSPPAARVLTLGGDLVDPPRALELGLVDELAAPDDVVPRAIEVARTMSELPRGTYGIVKNQVRGDLLDELQVIVEDEEDPLLEGWLSDETEQAAAARLREGSQ
jgi:enoyl-CoA hydratase/carnithine racemase